MTTLQEYEVWLSREDGTRIELLETVVKLAFSLVVNDIGACTVVLPGTFDVRTLRPDQRIEIWRRPQSGNLYLERIYFVRGILDETAESGQRQIVVTGLDGNYLLTARIVAYNAGSSQADKTGAADNVMKAIVRENLGASATDTARRFNASYFSVQPDLTLGPTVTRAFSRLGVLNVLQDLSDAAEVAGTDVFFDVAPLTSSKLDFQTFTNQRGVDRRFPAGQNPVILGLEYGNLAAPALERDWEPEATFVYGGGQGEGEQREIVTVEDTVRSARSIWGRREAFADARNETTTNGVTAAARARLAEGKPRLRFGGQIAEAPQTRYGLHWRWGDRVSALYGGQRYDAHIRAVRISLDGDGDETVEARLETFE